MFFFFFLMVRRHPRFTFFSSSAASDVYKRQVCVCMYVCMYKPKWQHTIFSACYTLYHYFCFSCGGRRVCSVWASPSFLSPFPGFGSRLPYVNGRQLRINISTHIPEGQQLTPSVHTSSRSELTNS